MKIITRNEYKIKKQTLKVSTLYAEFKKESETLANIIQPYLDKAHKNKDLKLIDLLLLLTTPTTKGCGDYIGRFYLFLSYEQIKKDLKKSNPTL